MHLQLSNHDFEFKLVEERDAEAEDEDKDEEEEEREEAEDDLRECIDIVLSSISFFPILSLNSNPPDESRSFDELNGLFTKKNVKT